MNQHSIPIGVYRKLGLDNIEPSGMEGDRRPVADVASKEKEAAKEARRLFWRNAPDDFEDLVNRVRWMSQIAWDELREMYVAEGGVTEEKVRHLVRATAELGQQLFAEYYGRSE